MENITNTFIDLTNQREDQRGAVHLNNVNDLLMVCTSDEHQIEDITEWDQLLSAMSNVAKWAPKNLFRKALSVCDHAVESPALCVQTITFLGLAGYLCIAKEITAINKVYVSKRWAAYCAGAGVVSLLDDAKKDRLIAIVMANQAKLYQTEVGRAFARRVIEHELSPMKIRDQILLVYTFAGMKACVTMYSYIGTGPLVVIIPAVMGEIRAFKLAYEKLRETAGSNFPYLRLLGGGEELNHSKYPDLYYCAVSHSKNSGQLGGKTGNFVRSSLATVTDASVLDRLCKYSSLGTEVSDASLEAWRKSAEELGVQISDQDLKRVKRKVRRRADTDDEEDYDEPSTSKRR